MADKGWRINSTLDPELWKYFCSTNKLVPPKWENQVNVTKILPLKNRFILNSDEDETEMKMKLRWNFRWERLLFPSSVNQNYVTSLLCVFLLILEEQVISLIGVSHCSQKSWNICPSCACSCVLLQTLDRKCNVNLVYQIFPACLRYRFVYKTYYLFKIERQWTSETWHPCSEQGSYREIKM